MLLWMLRKLIPRVLFRLLRVLWKAIPLSWVRRLVQATKEPYRVIRVWNDSFWITNPDYVEEEQTLTSSSLTFYPYEATIPGDNWLFPARHLELIVLARIQLLSVVSPTEIVVQGLISSVVGVNLTGLLSSFYINEGTPYTGYKQVYLVAMQPGTTNMNEILFTTLAQYEKMNQSAGVEVNALQKLEFPVTTDQGIDGYKYNTGLIQAANRVVVWRSTRVRINILE
jgi:hypothetical protein